MFGCHYKLSFDHANRNARGQAGFKMGDGSAGYTTAWFDSIGEAKAFADSVPAQSRMPNHGAFQR